MLVATAQSSIKRININLASFKMCRPTAGKEVAPSVKSRRSALNMCVSWCLQPLRDTNADSTKTEPIVKHIANFEGASMMTGRKIVNARTRKITPPPRKAAKYASWVDEGICRLQRASTSKLGCNVSDRSMHERV